MLANAALKRAARWLKFRPTINLVNRVLAWYAWPAPFSLIYLAASMSVTTIAPPVFSALKRTLSPALTLSSMAGSLT